MQVGSQFWIRKLTTRFQWAPYWSTAPVVCDIYSLLDFSFISPRPMSHISAIFGSDDDQEILDSLYTIVNVSTMSSQGIVQFWHFQHRRTHQDLVWFTNPSVSTKPRTIREVGLHGRTVISLRCFWTLLSANRILFSRLEGPTLQAWWIIYFEWNILLGAADGGKEYK
jgi:hypothetical protein